MALELRKLYSGEWGPKPSRLMGVLPWAPGGF